MTEQPGPERAPEPERAAGSEQAQAGERVDPHRAHVRTDRETAVDDALGGEDDPH